MTKTPTSRLVAIAVMAVLAARCGTADEPVEVAPVTSPSPEPQPTVTVTEAAAPAPAPVEKQDRCGDATDELVGALDTLLDRIDADPDIMLDRETDAMFEEFGALLGRQCSIAEGGPALSTVFAFLADEANRRSSAGRAFIDGLLGSLCDAAETSLADRGYELTSQGKLACLRS